MILAEPSKRWIPVMWWIFIPVAATIGIWTGLISLKICVVLLLLNVVVMTISWIRSELQFRVIRREFEAARLKQFEEHDHE